MKKLLAVALFALLAISAVSAQQKKAQSTSAGKYEVFAGYSLSRAYGQFNIFGFTDTESTDNCCKAINLNGGELSATYYQTPHFGLTFDFNSTVKNGTHEAYNDGTTVVSYTGGNTQQQYLIGPTFRYTLKGVMSDKVALSGHFLAGAAHVTTDEGGTYAVNGTVEESFSGCADEESSTTCKAWGPAVSFGGAVDYKVARHISIRPAQFDYWIENYNERTFWGDDSETWDKYKYSANGIRYSAGVVVNF